MTQTACYALVCSTRGQKRVNSIAIYRTNDAAITGLLGPDWRTRAIGKYVKEVKEGDGYTQVFNTGDDTWYVMPVENLLGGD